MEDVRWLTTNSNINAGNPLKIGTEAGIIDAVAHGITGRVIEYTGETTGNYTEGAWYVIVEDD